MSICLVVDEHIVEGVVHLVRAALDLQLLAVDLVFDIVDPQVQLRYVHLSVLEPEHSRTRNKSRGFSKVVLSYLYPRIYTSTSGNVRYC